MTYDDARLFLQCTTLESCHCRFFWIKRVANRCIRIDTPLEFQLIWSSVPLPPLFPDIFSCCNPPSLYGLGQALSCAGLHAPWLDFVTDNCNSNKIDESNLKTGRIASMQHSPHTLHCAVPFPSTLFVPHHRVSGILSSLSS